MKKATALLLLLSCRASEPGQLKEAPDTANKVSRFQITEMPTYEIIAENTKLTASKLPWSDTFWPLNNKGMARRWSALSPNYDSKMGFMSFWEDQEKADAESGTQLSPAEKYDAVYRWRWGIEESTEERANELKALFAIEDTFDASAPLSEKRKIFATLHDRLMASSTLRESSPMVAEAWSSYLNYNKNSRYKFLGESGTGDSWGWMGYCHGWAPAAIMAEAPKHAVLADVDGKEIFFSEGDIRGLLTKAWADHWPARQRYFLGKRCNENVNEQKGPIPHGEDGRGVSGTLKVGDANKTFLVVDEYLTTFSERRVYQILYMNEAKARFLLEQSVGSSTKLYYLTDDLSQVRLFARDGAVELAAEARDVKFYGCWDVNPASLHTVLIDSIGKKDMGIVMDRTRTGQVWNQPVQAAEFELGELLPVAAVEDPLFRYRAMGTEYLLKVTAKLRWSSEPTNPSFDYPDDFDEKRMRDSSYTYTLEFDADKRLIGGEWGDFEDPNPMQVIPDFLFAFKKGAVPVDDLGRSFDYSGIIGPLAACAQAEEGLETRIIKGKDVTFSRCSLSVARSLNLRPDFVKGNK